MTNEIVNLRRARKARDRAERETVASANRVAYGRTKADRQTQAIATAHAERVLDGHRLVVPDGDDA